MESGSGACSAGALAPNSRMRFRSTWAAIALPHALDPKSGVAKLAVRHEPKMTLHHARAARHVERPPAPARRCNARSLSATLLRAGPHPIELSMTPPIRTLRSKRLGRPRIRGAMPRVMPRAGVDDKRSTGRSTMTGQRRIAVAAIQRQAVVQPLVPFDKRDVGIGTLLRRSCGRSRPTPSASGRG